MDIIYIILIISIVINLIAVFVVRNLLLQNEAIEDTMINVVRETKETVSNALLEMENADINGSFANDDEVGVAFKDIKDIIKTLNEEF